MRSPLLYLLLPVLCSLSSQCLQAQKSILNRPFHAQLQKGSLRDFLQEINARSGITIEYANGNLPLDKEIEVSNEIATLGALLQALLAGQHIRATERNGKILLVPSPTPLPDDAFLPVYSVFGLVNEAGSLESLSDAVIWEPATRKGTVCNIYGYFSLSLPEGPHRLEITHTGHKPRIVRVDLHWNQRLDIALELNEAIPEVVVSAVNGIKNKDNETIAPGRYDLYTHFLGENDAFRSIYLSPGVTPVTDASSGLLVRGGEQDENLFLLDGNPIFNPTHMLGALSIVDRTSLRAIQFYKSGFPSRYGGALSSVIDVYTKDGNMQHWSGEANVNFLAASVTVDGPLRKDRTSIMASVRHSMPNYLLDQFQKDFFTDFYDAHLKVSHLLDRSNKLTVNLYAGEDNLDLQTSTHNLNNRQRWGNLMASLGWTHVLGAQSFVSTSLNATHYHNLAGFVYTIYDTLGNPMSNHSFNTYSSISQFNFRTQFEVNGGNHVKINYGAEAAYTRINPFESKIDSSISLDPSSFQSSPVLSYGEYTLYAESEIRAGGHFSFRPGVHFSFYQFKNYTNGDFQPRLLASYRWAAGHQLYLSYDRMIQNLHLVTNPSLGINSDLWVPSTSLLKPENSQSIDLGYTYRQKGKLAINVDLYWKHLNNVTNYAEGKSFFINTDSAWEQNIDAGRGWSYGGEIRLEKTGVKWNAHIAYALSWNWRRFDQLNQGRKFPFKYDRRHNLNVATSYKLDKTKEVSALWMFATGDVYSFPESIYPDYDNAQQIVDPNDLLHSYRFIYHFSGVNRYRTPPYSRLDLSFSYRPPRKKNYGLCLTGGVYNVYGAPSQYSYGLAGTVQTRSIVIVSEDKFFNITPYISATIDF